LQKKCHNVATLQRQHETAEWDIKHKEKIHKPNVYNKKYLEYGSRENYSDFN